jgi:hypothetical protein
MTVITRDAFKTIEKLFAQYPQNYSIQASSAGDRIYVELCNDSGQRFREVWIADDGTVLSSRLVE